MRHPPHFWKQMLNNLSQFKHHSRPLLNGFLLGVLALALSFTGVPSAHAYQYSRPTFDNIVIPSSGNATPYPSTITVNRVIGALTNIYVILIGVSHSSAADIDILLVSPNGVGIILMSDVCEGTNFTDDTLTFHDSFPSLPDASGAGCGDEGAFSPTNYESDDDDTFGVSFTATNMLSVFNGISPNGNWMLYVVDDSDGASGSIAGGWQLSIETDANDTLLIIDSPANGASTAPSFQVSGWALDPNGTFGAGVWGVDVFYNDNCSGSSVAATHNIPRPDVRSALGLAVRFTYSGWTANLTFSGAGTQTYTVCIRNNIDIHYTAI